MENLICVTGGTGYIGSHTVVELQNRGFEVVVVDNLSNSEKSVLEGIESITGKRPHFEEFDICDQSKFNAFLQKYTGIKAFIHFAAYKAVGESVNKPLKYYRNNLQSLMNILEGMRQFQIPSLVFSSSCTVYGQPEKLPVDETAPVQQAISPYGNTKQISEEIISDFVSSHENFNAIALRYFNPIGAHPSAKIGELPLGVPDNLVPFITQTAIGLRKELKVFGDDYNTPDGSAIRDYIHVVDLARAHVVAIERMISGKRDSNWEVFNIGTGEGASVLEVIKTFIESTGVSLNYTITERRPGDVEQVWAETTRANEELGWKAELSLADALKSAWEWEKYYRNKK